LETVLYGCRFRRVTRWAIVDRSVVDIRTGTGGVKVLQWSLESGIRERRGGIAG